MQQHYKTFIRLMLAVLAAVLLAACGSTQLDLDPGGDGQPAAPTADTGGDPASGVTSPAGGVEGGLETWNRGPVTPGDEAFGNIDTEFEADIWTFEAEAGQDVRITVEGVTNADPRVELYGPGGAYIAGNDDIDETTNDAQIQATLPVGGQYSIQIDMILTTGNYVLTLELLN